MKFFIPHVKPAAAEGIRATIVASLVDQFRLPINERRIVSLDYVNGKRNWRLAVGELDNQENRYEILAIFESKSYIVYTRAKNGGTGVTILVDKDEVTAVEYFDGFASETKPVLV